MKQSGIDVVRVVWLVDYEALNVEPSADCPGYVRLLAKPGAAEDFWGRMDVQMPAEMARLLGQALIACADEQDAEAA